MKYLAVLFQNKMFQNDTIIKRENYVRGNFSNMESPEQIIVWRMCHGRSTNPAIAGNCNTLVWVFPYFENKHRFIFAVA